MKKRKLNGWMLAFIALAATLLVLLYIQMRASETDTYTVRLYRTSWNEERGYEVTRSIAPRPEAAWRSEMHEAPPVPVRFDGAVLRQGAGYGPTSLEGAFAAEDVNELCGREVLREDWVFSWGLYFTNDWYHINAYVEVRLPEEESGLAEATMTVYHEGYSAPACVMTWTGEVGEPIRFGAEEL
ncbi:MAG: hypothetical protein IJE07_08895 [Clostridia bacterium]|nr:hypothetical protein [Clostridia bacterium]